MSLCQDLHSKIQNIKAQITKLEELKKQISICNNQEELSELKNEKIRELRKINKEFNQTQEELEGLKYNFKEECLKIWEHEVNEENLEKIELDENGYIEKIDFSQMQIQNIPEEIEFLTNLQNLDLFNNSIQNIESLKSLFNLKDLNLEINSIEDIEPLKGLFNLHNLNLSGNPPIEDIEPLKGLFNLQELNLSYDSINDIEPLENLFNLQKLDLSGNDEIEDIKPLKGLLNLQDLDLSFTQVKDIEPLKGLLNLQELNLGETQIKGIKRLKKVLPKTNIYF